MVQSLYSIEVTPWVMRLRTAVYLIVVAALAFGVLFIYFFDGELLGLSPKPTPTPTENVVAFVLVITDVGKEQEVADAVRTLEGVDEAWTTYGSWDVIAIIKVETPDDLYATVTQINKIAGVANTETLITGPK